MGTTHQAWLNPLRGAYLESGLTLSELSVRVRLAKSKLSEMLRGMGLYPRWEIVLSLAAELKLPDWPLYRLWRQAALEEARKSREWVERSGEKTLTAAPGIPPLDLAAFRELVEEHYWFYASCFLDDLRCQTAVDDTFDILWLRWNEALASPDTRRFAWSIVRTTVMSRTPHHDCRPSLGGAVFDTAALRSRTTPADRLRQLTESLELFAAISRLPDNQLDVIVLRYLCGMSDRAASALLGLPLASVHSDERHASRYLEGLINPASAEGDTA
ncbi:sigma-70 family RNA polymerase sigma factor [Streptomyces sp. NPDC046925]|uniref:sigma-70 family RNA polymerase sigma factor n=1 Tax=Streptomyces sp. NPDC046925 TaxID=3155375 RepID=UPI0033E8DE8B